MKSHIRKQDGYFLPALFILAVACFLQNFDKNISNYVSTMFAINYDFGLIPNGFMGTLFKGLELLLPLNIYNYQGAYQFSILFTLLLYVLLFFFYKFCLKESSIGQKRNMQYLIVFLSIFAFSMYSTSTNFGYFDIYLYIFTLISIILIIKEKFEWLVVPLGFIGMLILQDFIFSHAIIIFVLLLYKIMSCSNEKKAYYICIASLFLICVVGWFVYFEWFCVVDGNSIAGTIKTTAATLSENGKSYSNILIKGDILQEDMTEYVAEYRLKNSQDLPTFCIIFAPYIFFGIRYFIKLITDKKTNTKMRFAYAAFLLGGVAMIPLFVQDIYYGRYVFYTIFYYVVSVIALIAMKDTQAEDALNSLKENLKKITPFTLIWILYPIFLLPLRSIAISNVIHQIALSLFG